MMESLDIEKKLAADLMAFLDDDDSGEMFPRLFHR